MLLTPVLKCSVILNHLIRTTYFFFNRTRQWSPSCKFTWMNHPVISFCFWQVWHVYSGDLNTGLVQYSNDGHKSGFWTLLKYSRGLNTKHVPISDGWMAFQGRMVRILNAIWNRNSRPLKKRPKWLPNWKLGIGKVVVQPVNPNCCVFRPANRCFARCLKSFFWR